MSCQFEDQLSRDLSFKKYVDTCDDCAKCRQMKCASLAGPTDQHAAATIGRTEYGVPNVPRRALHAGPVEAALDDMNEGTLESDLRSFDRLSFGVTSH